jgi:hypothetical protein
MTAVAAVRLADEGEDVAPVVGERDARVLAGSGGRPPSRLALIAVVAMTCATTIAKIVSLSPCGAATAIAVKRSAIRDEEKNARMSYRPRKQRLRRRRRSPCTVRAG